MVIFFIVTVLVVAVFVFMQQPQFGRLPSGERLEKIRQSPNYRNDSFQNISHTPDLTEDATYYSVMKEFLFGKKTRMKPIDTIPSIKTDLLNLNPNENVLVWFGHSSYFIQVDGKRILVDPVLNGSASPLSFTTQSFPGTDIYKVDELPDIDYLFISHDHWDHLDYKTITQLKGRVKKVICGLGTGEHFEYWGYDKNIIIERDWNEVIALDSGFIAYTVAARHFSGRGFSRNKALWSSYVLQTPTQKIFIGGDSGYDNHFAEIGDRYGPFDLAMLENGQYDKSWKYIHMMPEEVILASKELKAKRLFPVHSGKFVLGNHPWDEPLKRIKPLAFENNVNLVTPMIGQPVYLNDTTQVFTSWWEGVD
jgi:L-ascorbate metabolism protein UlaG (beta-lactamase superfamily)